MSSSKLRERYLAMRRDGRTRGQALADLGVVVSMATVSRWERWLAVDPGQAPAPERRRVSYTAGALPWGRDLAGRP